MFTVNSESKTLVFKTKEELIRHYVIQDATHYISPENYVPNIFSDIAMNKNDRRSMGCGKILGGEFWPMWYHPDQQSRKTIVYDGDGRIIDIRPWLPEFRAAMKEFLAPHSTLKKYSSNKLGSKPRFRKAYRVAKGFKQKQMRPEEIDRDEILQYMPTVPVHMTRREADKFDDWGFRNGSRSWKDQSKYRKSWQRRAAQASARQSHKQDWLDETLEIEREITEASDSDGIETDIWAPSIVDTVESDFMDMDDEFFQECKLSA